MNGILTYAVENPILLILPALGFVASLGLLRVKDRYLNEGVIFRRPRQSHASEDVSLAVANMSQPTDAEAYFKRGTARSNIGDLDGALYDYDEAIRLKPDYAAAYSNRGLVHAANGSLLNALHDFDEAIRLEPDARTFYYRGFARSSQGDLEGALCDYDEAIRLKPDYAAAYNERGVARQTKHDLNGALHDFDIVIWLRPDYVVTHNSRGALRQKLGDHIGSQRDFEIARGLRARNAESKSARGTQSDPNNEEERWLAVHSHPDDAPALYHRGIARRMMGDLDGSQRDFDDAMTIRLRGSAAFDESRRSRAPEPSENQSRTETKPPDVTAS
ncbi:tetratricopeptide repeat protein [Caballeronia sp. J97]|uniref:tetratricopeptide repeat protein n=1 Tax=Caballeronia sp. J97 TaxID=2805429 RepID=UPI002AB278A9|nr:tetratricopeptide repeat protein [Caballeronia sp. J97]